MLNKKTYPIPKNKIEAVKAEIRKILDEDIIEVSDSEFFGPLVCVNKPNVSIRLCLNVRQINQYIIRMKTEPPSIDDVLLKFEIVNL